MPALFVERSAAGAFVSFISVHQARSTGVDMDAADAACAQVRRILPEVSAQCLPYAALRRRHRDVLAGAVNFSGCAAVVRNLPDYLVRPARYFLFRSTIFRLARCAFVFAACVDGV